MAAAKDNSNAGMTKAVRREKVVELRLLGYSARAIAEKVGVKSHVTVMNDLRVSFKKLEKENKLNTEILRVRHMIELDRMRLDIVGREGDDGKLLPLTSKGIELLLKIQEREAKLNGLDAPTKIQAVLSDEQIIEHAERIGVDPVDFLKRVKLIGNGG